MKRGYYKFEQECIETQTKSQDTTEIDIYELLSELDPKVQDIKVECYDSPLDLDRIQLEKKAMKIPRKRGQLLKSLISQSKQLQDLEMLEFDKKGGDSFGECSQDKQDQSGSRSKSPKKTDSQLGSEAEESPSQSRSRTDRTGSGSDEDESDSLTSDSDSQDAIERQK